MFVWMRSYLQAAWASFGYPMRLHAVIMQVQQYRQLLAACAGMAAAAGRECF